MSQILFLAHRVPYPPDRGDKVRSYNVLRHLARHGDVHLAAFADDAADLGHDAALRALCKSHVVSWRGKSRPRSVLEALATGRPASLSAFRSGEMQRHVTRLLAERRYDAIYVYSGQMAQYVPVGYDFVMDFVDMDSAKFMAYSQNATAPTRWILRREARLLRRFESAVAKRAKASLFVSKAEADLFVSETQADKVYAIENGIDTATFDPAAGFERPTHEAPMIVFTGQMDYRPNIEAVTWFADAVLPMVRQRMPNACFAIVGRQPSSTVRTLTSRPGVIVTGAVADVRGWLAAADVVVAPLKIARGIQNKVLEAMAMARPVVASPAAAEGIDHDGTIHVGRDAAEQAEAIVALMTDPTGAATLGRAARAQVVARYGWDGQLAQLAPILGIELAQGTGA